MWSKMLSQKTLFTNILLCMNSSISDIEFVLQIIIAQTCYQCQRNSSTMHSLVMSAISFLLASASGHSNMLYCGPEADLWWISSSLLVHNDSWMLGRLLTFTASLLNMALKSSQHLTTTPSPSSSNQDNMKVKKMLFNYVDHLFYYYVCHMR